MDVILMQYVREILDVNVKLDILAMEQLVQVKKIFVCLHVLYWFNLKVMGGCLAQKLSYSIF